MESYYSSHKKPSKIYTRKTCYIFLYYFSLFCRILSRSTIFKMLMHLASTAGYFQPTENLISHVYTAKLFIPVSYYFEYRNVRYIMNYFIENVSVAIYEYIQGMNHWWYWIRWSSKKKFHLIYWSQYLLIHQNENHKDKICETVEYHSRNGSVTTTLRY